jgi:hypothetical protein
MAAKKNWKEGEIIATFHLQKTNIATPLMQAWLSVAVPKFDAREQGNFDNLFGKVHNITSWSEEDLKMKFISPVLELSTMLTDSKNCVSFFDKSLSAVINGYKLSVKTDFVIAKGVLDYLQKPYFHFQEYKPEKKPTGDSMAQLIEAFLIAQTLNKNDKPIYGCEVNGAIWKFVVMEDKKYCVSHGYDSTDKEDLLQIIGILRKFKYILETELLD